MTTYHLEIRVKPRPGLLDPEGTAVRHALDSLGFPGVTDVRMGRLVDLTLEAEDEAQAIEHAEAMCRKLLANPVTEDYAIMRVDRALTGHPS